MSWFARVKIEQINKIQGKKYCKKKNASSYISKSTGTFIFSTSGFRAHNVFTAVRVYINITNHTKRIHEQTVLLRFNSYI